MGLFDWLLGSDKTAEDFYSGKKWQADVGAEPTYQGAGSYSRYTGGALGGDMESTVRQMLSGQPSQAQQLAYDQRFKRMLGQTRGSTYGAPGSARMTAETNVARQNALDMALLGEQMRTQGLSSGQNLLNFGAGENQFEYNARAGEADRANRFNVGNYQYKGNMLGNLNSKAWDKAEQFNQNKSNLLGAGVKALTSFALPGIADFGLNTVLPFLGLNQNPDNTPGFGYRPGAGKGFQGGKVAGTTTFAG